MQQSGTVKNTKKGVRRVSATAYDSHKPLLGHAPREASAHVPQFCNVTKDEECFPRLPNFSALLCGMLFHQCRLGDFSS